MSGRLWVLWLGLGLMLTLAPGAAAQGDPLTVLQGRLQAALEDMDRALEHAAQRLAQDGIKGPQSSKTLAWLCADRHHAIDCAAINPQGVMVVLEPAHFKPFEGTSIANQAQVIQVQRERKPVLSGYFHTVEGVGALDMEYPVLEAKGGYLGSVSIIFDPARLVERLAADLKLPAGSKVFLAQLDGRMLYSSQLAEIGRNLRNDPLYAQNPEVQAAVDAILGQEQGQSGPYQYQDISGQAVRRTSRWVSLGIYGVTWRLGLAQPEG